jgi:hypothetical protein
MIKASQPFPVQPSRRAIVAATFVGGVLAELAAARSASAASETTSRHGAVILVL